MTAAPLDGLRVVNTSTTLAGAHVALFLADNGADVLDIEPPGGSPLRRHPGYPFLGRGRSSAVLDLHEPADLEQSKRLASTADVFLETWRPGVAERLGLGYDDLRARSPRVVYASITGFGRTGPYSKVKGYEGLVMAKLGVMGALSGSAPRPGPVFPSMPYASWSAAQTALQGVLAALHQREVTGSGQRVDTTLIQAIAGHDTWNWFLHLLRERYPDAYTAAPPFDDDGVPAGPLQIMLLTALTSDGRWLQFSQWQPHLFKAFMVALGLDWMFGDPEWAGLPMFEDPARRGTFWEKMLAAARLKTLAEWQEIFRKDPDVWAEIYRHGNEILDHPQLVADGSVVEIDDPAAGAVRQLGNLVHYEGAPPLDRPAPVLDQDRTRLHAATDPADVSGWAAPPTAPLAGVTVLELGTFYAGPFAATLLADLGARVIKVEPPEGDPIRRAQPFPESGGAKVLSGKESIAVDMSDPRGRQIVHDIARTADLVLQSYRPGVAERQEVDAETLRGINPALVYLHAPAYGTEGPCRRAPAFAPTIGAGAGIAMRNLGTSVAEHAEMSTAEVKDGARRLATANTLAYAQADGLAGLGGATALLLGLLDRTRSGHAREFETSMLRSAGHAMGDLAVSYAGMPDPAASDADLFGLNALYRLYPTADGWIFLAAPAPIDWQRLADALAGVADLENLSAEPRFGTADGRTRSDAALTETLEATFRARPASEWEELLTKSDVGCVAVTTAPVETVLRGPDFGYESGFVVDAEHPVFETYPRLAPLVSLQGNTAPRGGCLAGQHTEQILTELGYEPDRIAQLVTDRIVVSSP